MIRGEIATLSESSFSENVPDVPSNAEADILQRPRFQRGIIGIVEFSAIEFKGIIQPAETGTSGTSGIEQPAW